MADNNIVLKSQYRISFADAFIAATAIHLDAVLVHKDPEFEALNAILQTNSLPYKHKKKQSLNPNVFNKRNT